MRRLLRFLNLYLYEKYIIFLFKGVDKWVLKRKKMIVKKFSLLSLDNLIVLYVFYIFWFGCYWSKVIL